VSRLEGVAGVSGTAAIVLARLHRENLGRLRALSNPLVRAEVLAAVDDIAWAGQIARHRMSASGHPDMPAPDIGAGSSHADDDEISADAAMGWLGIRSDRHLRRLADEHQLGVKVGGRWRLSRTAVHEYRETRRSA
jgi:hypothetical protein